MIVAILFLIVMIYISKELSSNRGGVELEGGLEPPDLTGEH